MSRARDRLPTFVIGRSTSADIVLRDGTVSRLHAELVRARDGSWFLTDRGSTGGTFLLGDRGWTALRQEFVRPGDRLRFGNFECGADDLLRWIAAGRAAQSESPSDSGPGPATQDPPTSDNRRDDRPAGPVLRDPATGDVISAED